MLARIFLRVSWLRERRSMSKNSREAAESAAGAILRMARLNITDGARREWRVLNVTDGERREWRVIL